MYANETARAAGKRSLITIPGLGCGEFVGVFQGRVGAFPKGALKYIFEIHATYLPNIEVAYFDPYRECNNESHQINGISYLVRPHYHRGDDGHHEHAGDILPLPGIVLALSSMWTLIPAGVGLIITVIRTALEDRTLQEELPGYRDYARRVRYRLIPGIY